MVRVRAGDPSKTLASVQLTKAERAERTASRGQRIKIGTRIPSLDPIIRRRRRGLSDLPRPTLGSRPASLPPRPRPRPQFGTDFGVLQPFGSRPRPRPTRVTVLSPSERRDRLITVSSRSRLARDRIRRPTKQPIRKTKPKVRPAPAITRARISPFMPFQEISFDEGRREGRRFGEERPRRRAPPRTPRRQRRTEDFGLGNIFNVQF